MKFFIIFIFSTILCYPQSIPIELNTYKNYECLLDRGINWEFNSLLYSPRWQDIYPSNDNLDSSNMYFDLVILNSSYNNKFNYGLGLNIRTSFYKYFYTHLYAKFANEENAFDRYSGISRGRHRFGFATGEVDISGIGFDNNKFNIELGRGRIGQGAGDSDIQLSLNQESISYDYLSYGITLTSWKIRFFNGFLENIDFINRYISGKSIEKRLNGNFLISFSENVIYSGENRPFDFGYLNPISSHLEIELNERQNLLGTSSGNAVWEASFDWLLKKRNRLSVNFIIDEFVLDKVQIDEGKIHSVGSSIRFSFQPLIAFKKLKANIKYINTGTYLYKHGNGNNNFVSRGDLLGWPKGNDVKEISFGVSNYNNNSLIRLDLNYRLVGQESIYNDVYEPINGLMKKPDNFPSGNHNTINEIIFYYHRNISDIFGYNFELKIFKEESVINTKMIVNYIFRKS